MWGDAVVFAAKHGNQASGAEVLIGIVFIVIVAIIVMAEASARYDLNVRNGLPYCPQCNRQVSYRRDYCRACGYRFKTYGPVETEPGPAEITRQRSEAAWKHHLDEEALRKRREERQRRELESAERAALKARKKQERDKAYRAMGIEPGPLAWYWAQPDLVQALLLGLVIASPVVLILTLVFLFAKASEVAASRPRPPESWRRVNRFPRCHPRNLRTKAGSQHRGSTSQRN